MTTINPIYLLAFVPLVWFLVFFYRWMTNHNVVKQSLHYRWTNLTSNPNPLSKFYIVGHRWLSVKEALNFNFKQKSEAKKKGLKPIFVGNLRVWDKYAEDLHLPKFLRKSAEKTPVYIDPWSMAQTMVGIGGAGGGKTIFILNIIKQNAFALNVFFSKKGEFEQMFYRPGIDFMLNPILKDGAIHDILSEDSEFIAVFVEALMNATLGKSQDYFSGSAKQRMKVFCEMVKVSERDNNLSKSEKWEQFINFYEEEVKKAKGGKQKSELDVLSTVSATFREGLYLMAYRILNGARAFTAKDFIYKGNRNQNLFITGNNPDMLNLSAASLAVVVKYQLSRPDIEDWEKSWIVGWFLDEFRSLMRVIPNDILAEISEIGRGKRFCPLKFLQKLDKEDSEETSDLISNMMYLVVFSTTDRNTKNILTGMFGDITYREKKYNEESGSKDKGMLRSDERVSYKVVESYHLDILQSEDYSSIFFSPKQKILTKMYTPMVDVKPKPYVDVTTKIDEVEFIKWRMKREIAMDGGQVKSLMKDAIWEQVEKDLKKPKRVKTNTYEDELKEALNDIVSEYGDNPEYKNFKLLTSHKEMKTKHGDYNLENKIIRIYNMVNISREHFVGTAIHELSHHIENVDTGNSGHSKNFYTIYKKLVDIAIKKGVIDYQQMRNEKVIDTSDISQLEKYFPEMKNY